MLYRIQTFSFCSTHYQTLGVAKHDSNESIKQAYIKLAKLYHPDINTTQSQNKFKDITNAYNILKDPIKRKLYDQTLNTTTTTQQQNPFNDQQYNGWQYNGEYQRQWQQYTKQTTSQQFRYDPQQARSSFWYMILAFGGIVLIIFSIGSDLDNSEPLKKTRLPPKPKISDNPTSYVELKQIYDQLESQDSRKMQRYYTSQAEEDQTELRRQNIIFQGQNLNDKPYVIEQRRKLVNEEMKQKQFKIQVEQYEKVIKGDTKILKRKEKIPKKGEIKTKQGDLTLEGYAKQNKLDINKSIQQENNNPINISIEHLEQGYM